MYLYMGVFSDKFSKLDEITPGSSVAIATDAVNLARSLRLLQDIGLITLKDNLADENKIMPPKSTWFEPKLRSGLFIHSLE